MLTVDPGINTGLCVWVGGLPIGFDTITENKYDKTHTEIERVNHLVDMVSEFHKRYYYSEMVVIEDSVFWDSSFKSRTAARSGSLQFLSKIIGAYSLHFHSLGKSIKLVSPSEWKGQMPDDLVKRRVGEFLYSIKSNLEPPESIHACCAIGIGAHILGYKEFNHVTKAKKSGPRPPIF